MDVDRRQRHYPIVAMVESADLRVATIRPADGAYDLGVDQRILDAAKSDNWLWPLDSARTVGQESELTDDHVPPKVLLAKPYPANFPTVPVCVKRNKSFQKDDDYTASVIPMDVRALRNPIARRRALAVIRNVGRHHAAGFAAYLAAQRSPSRVLGMDGEPLGALIDVDRIRVDATGRHIVRGCSATRRSDCFL